MSFCTKEDVLFADGFTVVGNSFLYSLLPSAPESTVKVYLLGLAMTTDPNNTLEKLAEKLDMSSNDVLDAFLYWEELGLVQVINSAPPQIVYLAQKGNDNQRKIKPSKYSRFNVEMQSILSGRMLTITEMNAYYLFLEDNVMEPEALVAVAKYCAENKGNNINYPYILTVARSQLKKGNTTLLAVGEDLNSQYRYDEDLKLLFKTLKLKKKIEHSDRVYYEKWTKDFGFAFDVVNYVAKSCLDGGMKKLNALMEDYYKKGVFSQKEIEIYTKQKEAMLSLAKEVNKSLGVYYQSLDMVVDEYVAKWLLAGFDKDSLVLIAKYCFRSGIRTLAAMNDIVDKFYRSGIVNVDSINASIENRAQSDKKIKTVLNALGLVRNVTPADRQSFAVWTDNWNMPAPLIDYATERSVTMANPLAYFGKMLSNFKLQNVTSVEQAKALGAAAATTAVAKKENFPQRNYTDEEVSALFTDLDTIKI